MNVRIPKSVRIVKLESAPFKRYADAKAWTKDHGIIGKMSDVDTGGKGDITISVASVAKMLCGAALRKSVTPAIHYSALIRIRDIIRESFVGEIHPDYLKVNGVRAPGNPTNGDVEIAVLYGCVSYGGIEYRAKTTVKIFGGAGSTHKAYSYEICNIEILKGYVGSNARPRDRISMSTGILLNGVCDVNGAPLIRE